MRCKTKAMIWICITALMAVAFVFTLAMCKVAGEADDQLMRDRCSPRQESSKPVKTWTRYSVPLDEQLQEFVYRICHEYDVPVSLVYAVMWRESNYDPELKDDMYDGRYRSFGLMQVRAEEHTDRCLRLGVYNLLNPYQNVVAGVDYLSELLRENKGTEYALMAYNGGPTYAGEMVANNNVSSYTVDVMDMAELIEETSTTVEVY